MLAAAGCMPGLGTPLESALLPSLRAPCPAVHVAEEALSWVSISILVRPRTAPSLQRCAPPSQEAGAR